MRKSFLLWGLLFVSLPLWGVSQEQDSAYQAARITGKSGAVKASFKGGKLNISDRDGFFSLKMDNKMALDAGVHIAHPALTLDHEATPNKNLKHDEGILRLSNGFSLRYARMALKAQFYKHWRAVIDIDFAINGITLKDIFVAYDITPNYQIKLGQFKEPMSIECNTSTRYLLLPERPMVIDALTASHTAGLGAVLWGRYWWFSFGGFMQPFEALLKEKNRGHSGYAATARFASAPVDQDIATLHLGVYGTYRTPSANGATHRGVEFKSYSESRVDRRRFVGNSINNVNYFLTGGAELALRIERFLLQGEFLMTSLSRYTLDSAQNKVALPNALFSGWYVTASYTILGSHREYMPNEAKFNQPESQSKAGTLEIAARVSTLNLNDFHDANNPIYGGKALVYSGAINYMPVPNVKLVLAYLYADHDAYADDKGSITYKGKPLHESYTQGIDYSTIMFRTLFSF